MPEDDPVDVGVGAFALFGSGTAGPGEAPGFLEILGGAVEVLDAPAGGLSLTGSGAEVV